jgi:hypothetical protein
MVIIRRLEIFGFRSRPGRISEHSILPYIRIHLKRALMVLRPMRLSNGYRRQADAGEL